MNLSFVSHFGVIFVIVFVIRMASSANARPYLRSNLARTVYDRMMTDERLRNMDLSKLYKVDELALEDDVRTRFFQLSCDEDTQKFLEKCFQQSEWFLTQIWHTIAKSLLGLFMTQTSVNGLLGRGRMFVWSEDQAKRLLLNPKGHHQHHPQHQHHHQDADVLPQRDVDLEMKWKDKEMKEGNTSPEFLSGNREEEEVECFDFGVSENQLDLGAREKQQRGPVLGGKREQNDSVLGGSHNSNENERSEDGRDDIGANNSYWVGDRLLDIGAGDGHVTQVLASGAKSVDVTEASPIMRRRLRERGYRVLDTWNWMQETGDIQYNVITAMNLLDRCDTPKTLLRDIHRKLADDGFLIVALVLPFSPYVEIGSADNLPSENLDIVGSTVEEQVNSAALEVFPRLGFKLERWSRLPYLCEGDLDQAFYWLSDVVLVFTKIEGSSSMESQNITELKIEL